MVWSPIEQDSVEPEKQCLANNYHPLPVVVSHGRGVWVWDVSGKKYLDMMSAYSAVSHGHCHPRLLQTLLEQSQKLCIPSRAFHNDRLIPFARKLCEISGMEMMIPMNTGAEAVETAIKAARLWGYKVKGIEKDKAEIIVAENNFHGRTTTIVGFSSDPISRDGFGPFAPVFPTVPFGNAEAIVAAINKNTCAVMIEPIQGEAGVIFPPEGYLKQVKEICRQNNVLFILDEVQSGLGRTGKLFAFEYENAKPDGLILGKALGGGILPVSAFLARRDVLELFVPGSHGSTFGGNPLSAAVGLEALNVLETEHLVENSHSLGEYFLKELQKLQSPTIKEIRGKGLWIAIELDPKIIQGRRMAEKLLDRGLLTKETHATTLRLSPPLVITKEELDWALKQLSQSFGEI